MSAVPESSAQVQLPAGLASPENSTSDVPGQINSYIGTGAHASVAIVYQTIKWTFLVGAGCSLVFMAYAFFSDRTNSVFTDGLASIWNIFVPVITLALGYQFGRQKD